MALVWLAKASSVQSIAFDNLLPRLPPEHGYKVHV